MGAFTNDGGEPTTKPEEIVQDQELEAGAEEGGEEASQQPVGFETDVPDVRSDDFVQQGTEKYPVFKVDRNEFYQNMMHGRKRLRFKQGTGAQEYMSKTQYNRPFFVQYTDTDGKMYNRRIK